MSEKLGQDQIQAESMHTSRLRSVITMGLCRRQRTALVVLAMLLFPGVVMANDREDCSEHMGRAGASSRLPVSEWRFSTPPSPVCITAAAFLARQRAQVVDVADPASSASAQGYVPKTKDDNTPWRFDMNQNGRRMTAEEFDAWMKAKGIRVATGKPASEAATAQPATCTPTAEAAC